MPRPKKQPHMRLTASSAKLGCAVIHLANAVLGSARSSSGKILPSIKRGSTSFLVRGLIAFTKVRGLPSSPQFFSWPSGSS